MLGTPDHERLPHDSATDSQTDEESYFPYIAVRTSVAAIAPSRQPQPAQAEDMSAEDMSADESTAIARANTSPGRSYMAVTQPAAPPPSTAKNGVNGGHGQHRRRRERSRRRRSSLYRAGSRQHDGVDSEGSEDEHRSWWSNTVAKYGSISLDNKGSVARDHLALERTYLAYLRTSLAFSSIGIAVTQLFRLNTSIPDDNSPPSPGKLRLRQVGKPLGIVFLATAIIVLFVGFHRYFESQHWIIRGKFPASRASVFFMSAVAAVLMVVSLSVVLGIEPGALGAG